MTNELAEAKAAKKAAKRELLQAACALNMLREETLHALREAGARYLERSADVERLKISAAEEQGNSAAGGPSSVPR